MTFRSGLVVVGILVLGVVAWVGVPRIYRHAKAARISGLAADAFQKGDRDKAMAFAESALRLRPNDDEALRVMALLLLRQRHPESVLWLARWVEQNPGEASRLSILGNGALLMNDTATAGAALGVLKKIPGSRPEDILALESALLVRQGKRTRALGLYEEAAQRPGSGLTPVMRLNFANLLLSTNNKEDCLRGLGILEELALVPETRPGALRARVMLGVARRDPALMFPAADQLAGEDKASTEDLLLWGTACLQVQGGLPGDFFERLEKAVGNKAELFEASVRWIISHKLWDQGLVWMAKLLGQRPGDIYVCRARAALYAGKGSWAEMRQWLKEDGWPRSDPQRMIYELEGFRQNGKADASSRLLQQQLESALGKNPAALLSCDRLAAGLGWHKERLSLWDAVAENNATLPEAWLKRELRQALAARDTVRLYGLSRLLLIHRPQDRLCMNNWVTYGLLLDHRIVELARFAGKNLADHPGDKALATTLALARIKEGRASEAVDLFKDFTGEELRQPAFAAYYAMALGAAGRGVDAQFFTALAEKSPLLPEERQLAGLPDLPGM